jgi:5-methylcytosine-specific restriction enzyme A
VPYKPMTPCSQPGCPNAAVRGGRCEQHKRPTVRVPDGRSSAALGYGYEWQQIRAQYLRMYPVCAHCGTDVRVEVHHIVSKKLGGTNALDNLVTLCKSCHSRVTKAENSK